MIAYVANKLHYNAHNGVTTIHQDSTVTGLYRGSEVYRLYSLYSSLIRQQMQEKREY